MDFPGNSHNPVGDNRIKPPVAPVVDKEIVKVVSTNATIKKKSLARKARELFFKGDAKTAVKYVITGVIVPALKNMAYEAGSEGLRRTIYGESDPRRFSPGAPRISYNALSNAARRELVMRPDQPPRLAPGRFEMEDIVIASREEAELVIATIVDCIEKYKSASVAELKEACGLPSSSIDVKWGWYSLKFANVRQLRDGYLLELPQPEPL